jgi:Alkaline phosphatase PhoX
MKHVRLQSVIVLTSLSLLGATSVYADDPYASAPPYAQALSRKTVLEPIVTTGQHVPLLEGGVGDTFLFRGIPDGMGARRDGDALTLLVNHEFRNNVGTPFGTLPNGARVSELALGFTKGGAKASVSVRAGAYEFTHIYSGETLTEIVSPPRGLSRLCAGFLADERVGFDQPIFLHGEENPPPLTFDGMGGIAIADADGTAYTMPWLGHAEWENVVAVPGTGSKTVVFLLEDGPTLASQLYMWVGDKQPAAIDPLSRNGLKDGTLYVLVSDEAALNSEATLTSQGESTGVHWATVDPGTTDVDLEDAAQHAGAFGFVRIEDGAADKTTPGVFYFVTTGSPGTVNPFGRLYRLTFDPANPVGGAATLTILLDGSEGIVSPDNIDTNKHGEIVICEDPNYNLATELNLARDTSLWVYDVNSGRLRRIAQLDRQSAYAHAIAADTGNSASTIGTPGGWEFSGVFDAEPWLGRGSWIVNVQAHTLRIAPTEETIEGGQILHLVWTPGDVEDE